jgi:beta-galactosidase
MDFPSEFRWGVATAAYQIEGATSEDGRGISIWDTFAHEPGRIRDDHTGDVACDHYHRWAQDVDLMAGLGIDAYRFSVSWPRIQPDGGAAINAKGLDFYDRLTDALLAQGISPTVTLYHWDLPQALEDKGGWLNRDTAYRFAEFSYVVAERLADRAGTWITLNEPVVTMAYGYAFGVYAPGKALLLDALPTAHHQLLAHGLSVNALRSRGARKIGLANHYSPAWAADESAQEAVTAFDTVMNRLFTQPVLRGSYPDLSVLGDRDLSFIRDEDLAVIGQPIDLLGVNYYNPTRIAAPSSDALPFDMVDITEYPTTGMGWPIVPDALLALLRGLHEDYWDVLPPIHITENGCSFDDSIEDDDRIAFLNDHLAAVHTAMSEGVDVAAYYVWSLLDNFEWAEGYHPRFGLVHVDYETQKRTPKKSYARYRDLVTAQRRR